ncbi:unnamed protein product [Urochloa humidicola]
MEAARSRLFILLILSIVLYLAVISSARKSAALAGPGSEPPSNSPPASPTGHAIRTPPNGSHFRVPSLSHSNNVEASDYEIHRGTCGCPGDNDWDGKGV